MRWAFVLLGVALLFAALSASALAADEKLEVAKIQAATWSYVVFATTVTAVKIVALVLGYFITKLGYNTMMAGVQGKDTVELGAFGATFKFKGVTPGLALGILGILMMGWALSTKHQFSAEVSNVATELRTGSAETGKPQEESNDDKAKPIPPKL